MARKKEIVVNPKNAPAEAPTGDVVVLYGHTAIAGVSEAATIRCETENTICVQDLSIEYEPPAPATVTIPVYYTVDDVTYTSAGNITGIPGDYFRMTIDVSGYMINNVNWDDADHSTPQEITGFYYGENVLEGYMPNAIPQGFDRIAIIMSAD